MISVILKFPKLKWIYIFLISVKIHENIVWWKANVKELIKIIDLRNKIEVHNLFETFLYNCNDELTEMLLIWVISLFLINVNFTLKTKFWVKYI